MYPVKDSRVSGAWYDNKVGWGDVHNMAEGCDIVGVVGVRMGRLM